MAKKTRTVLCFLLILLIVSTGCLRPPGAEESQSNDKTTIGTTSIATTQPTPTPLYPMFSLAQIALTGKGGSSGLAIVSIDVSTQLYGTIEVKKSKGMWYTDGEQLITFKNITQVDKDYKFFDTGIDPANIPITTAGADNLVPESDPCSPLGDWYVNKGLSIYKLRNDFFIVNQTGTEINIGTWKKIRTKDALSYFIYWDYGPKPGFPKYIEKITVNKDLTKFSGINNYGEKITGEWTYTYGPIGTVKKCSDWPGGNEWWKK